MKNKGFTLVEVLIVVIIIGILAAIGIPQFAASIERAKGGEARAGLAHIQTAEKLYFAENEAYYAVPASPNLEALDLSADLDIVLTQKYWYFNVDVTTNPPAYTATATRKGGKCAGQTIIMDQTGAISGNWDYLNQ